MAENLNKPIYIKDLFEDDFIDKWIEYLFLGEENFKKKYYVEIDFDKIENCCRKDLNKINFESLNEFDKTIFYNNEETKYSIKDFYQQYILFKRKKTKLKKLISDEDYLFHTYVMKQYSWEDLSLEDPFKLFVNESSLPLIPSSSPENKIINFIEIELPINLYQKKYTYTEVLKEILDEDKNTNEDEDEFIFIDTNKNTDLFNYDIKNKELIVLKALKVISQEIFNLSISNFSKNYNETYKFWKYDESESNIIEKVFDTISYLLNDFSEQFCTNSNYLLNFAFVESFNISLNVPQKYKKYKTFDKDLQKTPLNNTFKALLTIKEKFYKKLANLSEKRVGGNKPNIVKEIRDKYKREEIFKYFELINEQKKGNNFQNFKKHNKEFNLLTKYFEKHRKSDELKKYNSIEQYFYNFDADKLALAMFLSENNYDIQVKTLYPKIKKRML
ncbi:MAG: hypothetical protein WCG23_00120 [bacterium]